jgi:polyribonucleotide nucleotidyltransferase
MVTFNIKPEKIKDVIGKGGDTITKIILESSNVKAVTDINAVKIDIDEEGQVIIYHSDKEIINKAKEMIENIVREPEDGKVYTAKVTRVEDFGCFVEIWAGCEGLVHVSELAKERVNKPSDMVKVGDEIIVKCIGYDHKGRLNFSRKKFLLDNEPKKEKKEKEEKEEVESKEE